VDTADVDASVSVVTLELKDNGTVLDTLSFHVSVVAPADNTPPAAPTLTGPSLINSTTPTLTGTAEAGSTVNLSEGGSPLGQADADGNGDFSIVLSDSLTEGGHDITATATDAANNVSGPSAAHTVVVDTTAPGVPTVTVTSPTTDTTPDFNGTAEVGSAVTILVSGSVLGQATADGSGNYTFTPSTPMSVTTHAVAVRAADAAGNVGNTSSDISLVIQATSSPGTTIPQYPFVPMTIFAKLEHQSYTAVAGDVVMAYVGNELRAKGTVQIEAGVPVVGLLVSVNAAVSGGESLSDVLVESEATGVQYHFVNKTNLATGSTIGNNGRYLLTDGVSQTLSFNQGWNFVSMHVRKGVDSTMAPAAYFGSNNSNVAEIRTYDGWYNPADPLNGVLSTLTNIELGAGYWVRASSAFNHTVSGYLGGDLTVNLEAGWNMAGYPRRDRRTVADAIGVLQSGGQLVQIISDTELFLADTNLTHFNTMSHFDPGMGYWIKVSTDAAWDLNFPELSSTAGGNGRGLAKADAGLKFEQLKQQLVKYPSLPAIVLAKLESAGEVPVGSVVAAFADDELRGVQLAKRVNGSSTVALVIHTEREETVRFALWNATAQAWQNINESLTLDSGDVLGSATDLVRLTLDAKPLAKGLVLSRDSMRLVVLPELLGTHKVQRSTDLIHWEDFPMSREDGSTGLTIDPAKSHEFYRLIKR
jgi:hypothetical protein